MYSFRLLPYLKIKCACSVLAVDKRHEKEPYYLESGYKSYYFYEDDALDANGCLKTDKAQAVCKVRIVIKLPVCSDDSYQFIIFNYR